MKSIARKDNIFIKPGTVIIGKWHKKKYVIKRKIGTGMIGTVYLCRMRNQFAALKISKQPLSMTAEVNVLKSLNKVQDCRLGPFLLDVDDWESNNGQTYSFYVMEYINGVRIETFVKQNGIEWIGVFLLQILEHLEQLHKAGWVFGDLKNENLLVTLTPPSVRFIDVGGTTKIGRSIKEYTAFYDRAYWNLGKREAEPSYDLFAVVMVVLSIFYPKHFKRTKDSKRLILEKLMSNKHLNFYYTSFEKAIMGKYKTAKEMKDDIIKLILMKQKSKNFHKKPKYGIEALLIIVITSIYYIIFYFYY